MKLTPVFGDHMVLQRDRAIAVWGWATAGDTITVGFAGQRREARAGDDGRWAVTLDPLPACAEGRTLVAKSRRAGETVEVVDVLVGEVWLASGQSNMWWKVGDSMRGESEVAAAKHPLIRLFGMPNRAEANPSPHFDAYWRVCSPETVREFSGVAYFFGRKLQQAMGVPVGLVHASWGGTRVEAWMSRGALAADAAGRVTLEAYETGPSDPKERQSWDEFARNPLEWEQQRVKADPGNAGHAQGWARADYDDAAWGEMEVPARWQARGHNYNGVFWFRRAFEVPAEWAGKDLRLGLGACDKHDTTYFNNEPVGAMGWGKNDVWCTHRWYTVPGRLVRAGRNVITVRVYSYMTDGGLIGPPEAMRVEPATKGGGEISLTGSWRFRVEHNFGPQPAPTTPLGPGNPNTPCILFDNMIRPLVPFALRGAIWYQGESNVANARAYRTLFPGMITDWRAAFGQPEMPFLFVQLANHTALQNQPVQSGWAELREAQAMTLQLPGTGMAVALDVGEADDIHPRNKQEVGRRLALAALGHVYARDVVYRGPQYRSWMAEGSAARVTFDDAGDGLRTRDGGPVRGFAIAGADGVFVWAEAMIDASTLVVRGAGVDRPSAVRYAWANNPVANLCNAAGLPASPFRTDID